MPTCDDLRLGGTLSSSGLSGGVSINATDISVADWSTLFGTTGMSGQLVGVYGRPGSYLAGDRLVKDRLLSLVVNIHRRSVSEDCTESELALMDNTDTFLDLISRREGTYLEVVFPDASTRFTYVLNLDPGPMRQPGARRSFNIPLQAPWGPWWSGGMQSSETIAAPDTIVVGGNQTIYDARLIFSGDGTFTHSDLGWAITITGSSGVVIVDLYNRIVTQAGLNATALMTRVPVLGQGRVWGWFLEGTNNVTSTVSTTVEWRNQWL